MEAAPPFVVIFPTGSLKPPTPDPGNGSAHPPGKKEAANVSPEPDPTAPGPASSPALVRAIQHLLRPLVGLLLARQLTFRFVSELLKGVYIEMADRDFSIGGKRQTTSRLSLLTGIHRKDVKRLREADSPGYITPPTVSLGSRLIGQWTSAAEFTDQSGNARALRRLPDTPDEPSFERLVASVSKDIRARSVLDEWRRLGVIEVSDDGWVRLVTEAFVPVKGFDEKAHYFGRNLHDHMEAGVRNLQGQAPPSLERSVHYTKLSEASVQELRGLTEELGMQTLQSVNRRAQELQAQDAGKTGSRFRMNFGMYFLCAGDDENEDADDPTQH